MLLLPLLAAVAALALAACGGPSGGDTAATAGSGGSGGGSAPSAAETDGGEAVPTIVIEDGEPVGGIAKIEVSAGEQIRFKVTSHEKEAEEIHVHGYDLMKDVPAGGTIEFDFPAEIEGIFEAEMEGVSTQILELQVNP
jgi:hypothetical protein